jgi:hypothetical protein
MILSHKITSAFCHRCVYAIAPFLFFSQQSSYRKLVKAGASEDELAQILAQLRALVRPTSASSVPPPAIPATKYTSVPYPPYYQTVVLAGASLHPQYPLGPHSDLFEFYTAIPGFRHLQASSQPAAAMNPLVATTAPAMILDITAAGSAAAEGHITFRKSTICRTSPSSILLPWRTILFGPIFITADRIP